MFITTLVRRVGKFIFVILLFFGVGRALPPAERYISEDFATAFCHFIYGDVNAEILYDVYFDIDITIIFFAMGLIYFVTLKVISKKRGK